MVILYVIWILIFIIRKEVNFWIYKDQGNEEMEFTIGPRIMATILTTFTFWWSLKDEEDLDMYLRK